MACLGEEALLALAAGTLEGPALESAVAHLDACADCRQVAALLARGDAPAEAPSASPATAPNTLGRYVLLNLIGAGAMGVVYRAYDPELDRKVALKVLRPDPASGTDPTEGRARLQREAQAMARVAHPNVIAVHDVGSVGEDVFIAMELVEAPTLRAWLAERPRTWREILDAFVQAGRGLAAAHAAGLVHRDFKPENVLVAADGRSRVTDFGLARPEKTSDSAAGTPAYMAPEQRLGQTDARSDLYAFCVSLWEALHGERPFASLDDALAGRLRPIPAGARPAPAWLRRVVERGLSPSAADRPQSMEALLAALSRDPALRRRRALILAGGVLLAAAVAAATIGTAVLRTGQCQGAALELQGAWDAERRAAVQRSFAATGKPFAADAFTHAAGALDAWAAAWTAMRTDACLATRVRGEQSEDLLDRRMACLDRKLAELRALTGLFARADARLVERAVEAAGALGPLDECADRERLLAAVPPPEPARRAAVEQVRDRLAESKAHRSAGSYLRAVEIATAALASARALGYPPLESEACFALGDAQGKASDYPAAEKPLRDALAGAEASRWDELAARAALRLAQVNGGNQLRLAEAAIWADLADAKARRLGGHPELRGAVAYARAMLAQRQGAWTESLARCREALPLLEAAHGRDSPRVGDVVRLMGSLLLEHGDLAASQAHHERALAIWKATLGEAHPDVALSTNSLGHVLFAGGRIEEAGRLHERAHGIAVAALGEEHPYVANALNNRARVAMARGEVATAWAWLERALQIRERAYGAEHPLVAETLWTMGEASWRQGDTARAQQLFRRSSAILEKALPDDHPGQATPLVGLGEISLAEGRLAEAREALERALRLRAEHPGEPQRLATARFALAQVIAAEQPERARTLAMQARDAFAGLGESAEQDRAAVERWLATMERDLQQR